MKAVIFDNELKLIDNHPKPSLESDEVLVRVLLAGVCNTDLELIKGYMGFKGVLGHEFVGVVEEAPDEYGHLVGKGVVGEINLYCGECATCHAGMTTHCPNRSVLGILNKDGAMAEYLTLPVRNLHVVPDGVSDEEAVFTEPLAAAFEILEQVHMRPTDHVLVMGDGKLGLLCAQVLGLSQAEITLVGKHKDKLSIVAARGVHTVLLNEFRPGRDYDTVVEATGTADGFKSALGYVRPRGTVVFKSTVARRAELNLAPVVIDEITIIGSRCGPFTPALRALEKKFIDVRPMISAVYPVSDAMKAFEHAGRKGALKVLVKFS